MNAHRLRAFCAYVPYSSHLYQVPSAFSWSEHRQWYKDSSESTLLRFSSPQDSCWMDNVCSPRSPHAVTSRVMFFIFFLPFCLLLSFLIVFFLSIPSNRTPSDATDFVPLSQRLLVNAGHASSELSSSVCVKHGHACTFIISNTLTLRSPDTYYRIYRTMLKRSMVHIQKAEFMKEVEKLLCYTHRDAIHVSIMKIMIPRTYRFNVAPLSTTIYAAINGQFARY